MTARSGRRKYDLLLGPQGCGRLPEEQRGHEQAEFFCQGNQLSSGEIGQNRLLNSAQGDFRFDASVDANRSSQHSGTWGIYIAPDVARRISQDVRLIRRQPQPDIMGATIGMQ